MIDTPYKDWLKVCWQGNQTRFPFFLHDQTRRFHDSWLQGEITLSGDAEIEIYFETETEPRRQEKDKRTVIGMI